MSVSSRPGTGRALCVGVAWALCVGGIGWHGHPAAAASEGEPPAGSPGERGAAEEEHEEIPPALTEYMGRTIAQTMHWKGAGWLTRATREREENAERMVAELGLKPGMTVCDMGCGNGYHALRMAKLVEPGGRVLGVDIQPEMLELLMGRARAEGIDNVVPVEGRVHDPRLEPASVDLILLVDVYHEFSHPEPMLSAMRRALKPGGRVVLVEFRAEDEWVPIKPLHKMSRKQVLAELEANGFKLVDSFDDLPWQHMLFFGRADEPIDNDGAVDQETRSPPGGEKPTTDGAATAETIPEAP